MESSSSLSGMSWYQDLRSGQKKTIDLFLDRTNGTIQLPTGYGKTLSAVASYHVLRERGVVNRILLIVPRRSQARQAAEDFAEEYEEKFGRHPGQVYIVGDDSVPALKAYHRGDAEIFVVLVQSLLSPRTMSILRDIMGTGRWFIVVDEHHHYGNSEDRKWSQSVLSLPSDGLLAMSATPHRSDGLSIFGMPDIVVTYLDAKREGAVKELNLLVYEYRVDAINKDGNVIRLTTNELFGAVGSDKPEAIEKWLASREMRWSPQYISPLVSNPISRMLDLRLEDVRAQMIIQAMSCSHAKCVCEQVSALAPENIRVDWVGTGPNGRSDRDNERILGEFCPPKDPVTKRRHWTLDILVNVGIAGEGLDTSDVCEIVFLTSPNKNNSTLQTIGRGARVIRGIKPQPVCTINVDGQSDLAEYIGPKIMEVFDEGELTEEEKDSMLDATGINDGIADYKPLPERLSVAILDVELIEIKGEIERQNKGKLDSFEDNCWRQFDEGFFSEVSNGNLEFTSSSYDSFHAKMAGMVEKQKENWLKDQIEQRIGTDKRFNESAILGQKREKVNDAVSKLAGLVARLWCAGNGGEITNTIIGEMKRKINAEKKRVFGCSVKESLGNELDEQWKWLKSLEAKVLSEGLTAWLR